MTTVAFKDGVLAVSGDVDWRVHPVEPAIKRLGDGSVIARYGKWERDFGGWDSYYDLTQRMPIKAEKSCFIHANLDKAHVHDGCNIRSLLPGQFAAFGQGEALAMAAMHAGASAERALEIAVLMGQASGPVTAMSVADGQEAFSEARRRLFLKAGAA